ncbi:protein phosphatase 1 regulatory subunit 26 [Chiroxiphia lanceolata]|uniref:protein phosphatase 1 regulatory subunit 26 n=1 Tax=Chiroxiphia lanceolata TaxID=296741 RepID=UPI0013CE5E16|nr:protein phosphatase 1 regulatory subunit 26 [Chiroxiphia lanceolata]XP_032564151.1 protein phosphatase 1 regulatory subunit 26 [Chiroxiphia lanceolata]XP_032564152.1 protein phosphatase 1 regulatory subunit 26 [Chiroxiphia lanceolata]XP_032564153.1 protein phosphatase 1 regulatory subunit 26 [Chiroxiphia lanceolata]
MFLMNAPPLVALQTKWESFGPARNCRYPVCFPESDGDVTRTCVSAKVQMIINNLQSQESALGMNNECGCIMQKKQKGEKGTSNRVTSSTPLLQKQPPYTKCGCPEDSDDTEVEENVEFGTLLLDSDSDDSVDRGIEEAIQEYLKAKGKSDQSLPRNAECSVTTSGDKRFKREFSQNKTAGDLLPVKFKAEMLSEEYLSDHLGIGKRLQPASPQSISSDDSFEQSIQAEIVQFLNEKKQQEISKCVSEGDKKDSRVRSVLKCSKETTNRTNCGAIKRGCKALLLRHHPKLQKSSTQSKCLQSKIQAEPSEFSQVNQAYLEMGTASQPWLLEQNEGSGARYWEPREALTKESMHTSDSSSDDGIEEAIQLYQLEKIRKEAGDAADCVPLQREQFDPKGMADISASLTISSTKSASPEIRKSPISNKRKEINSKSAGLESTSNDFNKLFKPLKKARHFALPENKIAACELTLQASCRADTSAELMCAEAILDISKTIMPSQMGSDNKSLGADSFFPPQLLSSSRCESDSSLVDSDDSIEQEIRAFLALKAQSENLGAKPPSLSRSIQMPLPSDQNSLTGTLEPSLPKTLKLSLSRKRRLKREGRTAQQGASKPAEQLQMGLFQAGNYSKFPVLQEECAPSSPAEPCDAQNLSSTETRQQQLVSPQLSGSDGRCVALDSVNPFLQVQSSTRKLVKNTTQTLEREGSDDESSSLDSDEDLDSAIKDLLRSKRKLKKKSKDQKSQCKKRVRFSETEAQLLDDFSSLQQNEWKCKNPALLKSCLSKPRKAVRENAVRNPSDSMNIKLPSEKPETMKNLEFNLQLKKGNKPKPVSNQRVAKNRKCAFPAVCHTEDSSSVDSDDSIEQEIRKFLAEKAKDSASNSEIQKDDLDLFRATKQTGNRGKAKQQPVENEINLVPGQSKKSEVPQQTEELRNSQRTEGKSAMLYCSGKCASSAENVYATGQSKAKQGVGGVKGGAGELPGNATGKKNVHKTEPPKPSKNEGCKVQKVMSAKPRSKRKNTFHLKISSKFIAGLKYARDRKKSMLLNKRQKAESLLAQNSTLGVEAASQDTDVLNPLPTGEFSGESTTAIKASSSSQKVTVGVSSPHVAETCAGVEAAPLCVKEEAEGSRKADASGDQTHSHLSLSSQEQSEAALKADQVCRGTSKAENTQVWMEEGDIHTGSRADSNVDPPRPECSVAAGKADKISRDTAQQSAQACSKGGNNPLDKRPDPTLACPQQELNGTAAAVDKTSGGACADNSVQMCIKEEKADRQEERQVTSSNLEGKIPVLQNREAASEVHQGQEFLAKTCAKFTDLSAGDCPDSLLEKKVSNVRRKGSCKKLKVLSRV